MPTKVLCKPTPRDPRDAKLQQAADSRKLRMSATIEDFLLDDIMSSDPGLKRMSRERINLPADVAVYNCITTSALLQRKL